MYVHRWREVTGGRGLPGQHATHGNEVTTCRRSLPAGRSGPPPRCGLADASGARGGRPSSIPTAKDQLPMRAHHDKHHRIGERASALAGLGPQEFFYASSENRSSNRSLTAAEPYTRTVALGQEGAALGRECVRQPHRRSPVRDRRRNAACPLSLSPGYDCERSPNGPLGTAGGPRNRLH
jgi:hypothetical protein